MTWIVRNLWLISALPILAAGLSALAPQRYRKFSATLAIGSMVVSFLLSLCAFAHTLQHGGHEAAKEFSQVFPKALPCLFINKENFKEVLMTLDQ